MARTCAVLRPARRTIFARPKRAATPTPDLSVFNQRIARRAASNDDTPVIASPMKPYRSNSLLPGFHGASNNRQPMAAA